NVGRAMVWSVAMIGIFWAIVTWGMAIGWGTSNVASFASSAENPMLVLAHRLWGGADIVLLVALWNSALAASLALYDVSTRMWFGMARAGALPKALAEVHPRFKTPVNAIVAETALALVAA